MLGLSEIKAILCKGERFKIYKEEEFEDSDMLYQAQKQ